MQNSRKRGAQGTNARTDNCQSGRCWTCVLRDAAIAPQPNMCPAWCGGCGFVTKHATRELRKRLTACLW